MHSMLLFHLHARVLLLQEREDGLTEWDRFARTEYLRLAMEEDAENDSEFCWKGVCTLYGHCGWHGGCLPAGDGGGCGERQ